MIHIHSILNQIHFMNQFTIKTLIYVRFLTEYQKSSHGATPKE